MKAPWIGIVAGTIIEVVAYSLKWFGDWDLVGTTDTIGEVWASLHPGLCLWMILEVDGVLEWFLVFMPSWLAWVMLSTGAVVLCRRMKKKGTTQQDKD